MFHPRSQMKARQDEILHNVFILFSQANERPKPRHATLVAGDNVRIDGAHLWDKVVVEDGCSISKSVLCNNVHIKG